VWMSSSDLITVIKESRIMNIASHQLQIQ
jgi:hypothetical protein